MANYRVHPLIPSTPLRTAPVLPWRLNPLIFYGDIGKKIDGALRGRRVERSLYIKNASSSSSQSLSTNLSTSPPCLSDIFWPSAGAFAAMAIMGSVDYILAPKGLSLTVPPFGAVCMVLLATPTAPAAKKLNMFAAHICCAAIGVVAFIVFGGGWISRSTALAASVAFMIFTGCSHPPAASLPLMFIDGAKFHSLSLWYAFFPGAAGCLLLCLIQVIVCYMKDNHKF